MQISPKTWEITEMNKMRFNFKKLGVGGAEKAYRHWKPIT